MTFKTMFFATLIAVFCISSTVFAYTNGDGSAGDPFEIASKADLLELAADTINYDKCFILTDDIDLATESFTGAVIAPDTDTFGGFQSTAFTGVFDGNNHRISNLTIAGNGGDYVGLFGYVGPNGEIKNLGITNANIQGMAYTGGLTGLNHFSTITACYVTGLVSGTSDNVGGLVGQNDGSTISYCYATANVNGNGWYVGGLVGDNNSFAIINNCYATGTVNGYQYVGGLAGDNFETISNCYATGAVSGDYSVGGLAGWNYGSISYCYTTGAVSGTINVGGFCGEVDTSGNYEDTANFWNTDTSGTTASAMGTGKTTIQMKTLSTFTNAGWDFTDTDGNPPVWRIRENITYPRLVLEQNGQPHYTGGSGTPYDPYQISIIQDWQELMSKPEDWSTSFILLNNIDLNSQYLTPIGNTDTSFTGTFDGGGHKLLNAVINQPADDYIGIFGYVGSSGQISNLGVENVNIVGNSYVGGLVASNWNGTITSCYVTGAVSGYFCVGGLLGSNSGTLTACYATSSVSGDYYVGGLLGYTSNGTITSCYATGLVNGDFWVGGLVGEGDLSVVNCFWDKDTSQQYDSSGGEGKSTSDMQTLSTFTDAGWDFSTTDGDAADWQMPANCYPFLAWQIVGDIAGSYGVNYVDFAAFAAHWNQTGCPTGCENADINNSGTVDISDLMIFADNWLKGI